MILVSPTERANVLRSLRDAAKADAIDVERSAAPEKRGVDFLWRANGQWWGVQRKELHDLLASLDDGRLSMELAQMRAAVTMPHLVVEGRIVPQNDGYLMTNGWGQPVNMSILRQRLLTIGYEGVHISYTRDVSDTARLLIDAYLWSHKAHHTTAQTRPKPTNDWGRLTNRDYQVHVLQGFPHVGPRTAAAIVDHFGRCPIVLDATYDELLQVPGVGPKIAKSLVTAMNQEKD
jgi:ERCC4-type nuclease